MVMESSAGADRHRDTHVRQHAHTDSDYRDLLEMDQLESRPTEEKRRNKSSTTTRKLIITGLLLATLASMSTLVQEITKWDPSGICGVWSDVPRMERALGTDNKSMYGLGPSRVTRTEFLLPLLLLSRNRTDELQLQLPAPAPVFARTVFFDGTAWNRPSKNPTRRIIYPMKLYPTFRNFSEDATRFYPSVDSQDTQMERRHFPRHEFDPHCEPMADWQKTFNPVCNQVHSTNLHDSLVDDDFRLLSSQGYWRHAWQMDEPNVTTVWKTFKLDHDMEEAFFENNRVDAVAMERLTASPGVISVYGLCGMTIVSEFAPKALADVVRDMNASQRLDLAVQVAQGVADVHSIDDRPSLSHNDLNLANLILTQDNRPVLNDFNVAVLLMKHNETGETCPFYSHFPNPQWKGPEEQVYSQVDLDGVPPVATEKVDIYALGNVLYRLAVGASPWKRPGAKRLTREEKDTVARLKRVNGTLPTIPDEVLQSTVPEVQTLLQAMRQCYQFNPKERPSAKEVVDFLRRSADGHRKDARQTAGP